MAKQIYIDSNGNEIPVSGTITNDNNLPHYTGTPTAGTTAYEIASLKEPTKVYDNNGITIYSCGAFITIGFVNATIDNVLSALSNYTTTYDIRFPVWNTTTAKENLISLKTSPMCINTNPWGSITGNDTLHGGFTFVLK